METNNEQHNDTKNSSIFHGFWGFFIFFMLLIGLMIGISHLAKWIIS